MKKKYLELAEKGFAILGLTLFTGGLDVGATLSTGFLLPSFIRTPIRYFIWLTAILIICLDWKNSLRVANRNKLIWILTAIIWLSFLWAKDPIGTLKSNREVLQMTSFGLYFATRFSLKEQVKLVARTFTIGALLSTVVALALPNIGIHKIDHPGAWRGIYDYKNTFGSMMIIGSLAFLSLSVDNQRSRLFKWAGIFLLLVMVLLSTSKTSLVLYFLIILILGFYGKFRWRGEISVVFLDIGVLILACVGLLVISNWVALLTGLGKDPTLTGRTILWSITLYRLQGSPWLGFGRSQFWAPESSNGREIGQALGNGFILPHAHNGFIDFALDVGYIGLSLFLIIYITTFIQALKQAYSTKNLENLWPLAFLIFLAMNNMTESFILRQANVYWVLFITVVLSVNQKGKLGILKTANKF